MLLLLPVINNNNRNQLCKANPEAAVTWPEALTLALLQLIQIPLCYAVVCGADIPWHRCGLDVLPWVFAAYRKMQHVGHWRGRRGLERGRVGFSAGRAVSDHRYGNHFILIHPYQPFLGLFSISLLPSGRRRLWPRFIMLGRCQQRSEWHCYPSLSLHHSADSQALLAPMDIAQQIFVRLVQTRYVTVDLTAKSSCLWLRDTSCLGVICSLK